MTPNWNAIRIDLIQVDDAMRGALAELRPVFARCMPDILVRFYDTIRSHDPACLMFRDSGLMQEALRVQLRHWDLIGAGDFGADYQASATRICELNQRGGIAPQWYAGCRTMFLFEQLRQTILREPAPRFGRASRDSRDRKALLLAAVGKVLMLDGDMAVAFHVNSMRNARKESVTEAGGRFRTIISSLSVASGELEATARALSDNANTTTRLAAVVSNASEDASNNVQSVASATEELAISVAQISQQVQDSNRIAASAVQQADQTNARINALSDAATRIGDVIKLITSVAEQTNLLALNATIEAARAGDAGRGFAVVAQEVKALAAQTAKATDDIGVQIAGMQSATQEAVGSIKMISATIGQISEITTTISSAIEQQGAATQEISGNIQRTAAGTSQVAGTIAEVSQGANQTGAASSQLLSSAKQLSDSSSRLQEEIDVFLQSISSAA